MASWGGMWGIRKHLPDAEKMMGGPGPEKGPREGSGGAPAWRGDAREHARS